MTPGKKRLKIMSSSEQGSSSNPVPPPKDEQDQKGSVWLQIARYSQIAFALPAATLIGWLLGSLLDRWLHTTWIYIAGLVLGMITGFVELIRMVVTEDK